MKNHRSVEYHQAMKNKFAEKGMIACAQKHEDAINGIQARVKIANERIKNGTRKLH